MTPQYNASNASSLTDDRLTVIRLGGSLLAIPDLAARLHSFAQKTAGRRAVIVVGGGIAVEQIRIHYDRGYVGDHVAHWSALQVMSDNARWLSRLMTGCRFAEDHTAIQLALRDGMTPMIHAVRLIQYFQSQSNTMPVRDSAGTLPESWDVTSDSVALWLCDKLDGERVWLLKSCDGPSGDLSHHDVATLSRAGAVDRYFPTLFAQTHARVRWVNLASDYMATGGNA